MPNFSLPDGVFESAASLFPTPFHLYDEQGIRNAAQAVNRAFSWTPGFREYFAVKALPNPRVLSILLSEGCGLDCASRCELMLAARAGASGQKIMFSANAMPPEEFTLAREMGAYINLDDLTDVELLRDNGGIPETVCLRYNPGAAFAFGGGVMGKPEQAKFGMTRPQLSLALQKLKALGARRFGLHAMPLSNARDEAYYPALARLLFTVGKELAAESGMTLAFVNLSGGVGIPYRPDEKAADMDAIGAAVEKVYREVLGDPQDAKVELKTELGRYIAGPYGWLVTHATHFKETYRSYIGLDACAANLLRPAMYGAYHHIHIAGKRDLPAEKTYDITGSLCENNDKFAVGRKLPEIKMGDLVIIHDTGAHGASMGYQYNGRLRCAEVLRRSDGSFERIRRAETPEDYMITLE